MGKRFIYPVIIVLLIGCSYRKQNFKHGFQLQKNLYIESYSAGLIGNLTSDYLTDSANFRLYAGTYDDENEILYIRTNGDSVIITKRVTDTLNDKTLPSRKAYSLKALKAEHSFK